MKILLLSDLHIEFTNNEYPTPQVECDVIVLAGDIGVGLNGIKLANKWNNELNIPIIIINGNHEYYGNKLSYYDEYGHDFFTGQHIRQLCCCNKNVHFLENNSVIIDGVRFLGCTLWTDFRTDNNLEQSEEMREAKEFMSDYRVCYYESRKLLTPQHTLEMHYKSKNWLNKELKKPFNGKTVVVTHHSPILVGNYTDKNGGFCNRMDAFIKNHNQSISAWFFGHTHFCTELDVHGVRVVSNQCGYPKEIIEGFNKFKIIEV
jgi:predicted phosphodiesterase